MEAKSKATIKKKWEKPKLVGFSIKNTRGGNIAPTSESTTAAGPS
ncbi:hypothetical protein ACFLSA_02515 [Bacteroidota bacterium]